MSKITCTSSQTSNLIRFYDEQCLIETITICWCCNAVSYYEFVLCTWSQTWIWTGFIMSVHYFAVYSLEYREMSLCKFYCPFSCIIPFRNDTLTIYPSIKLFGLVLADYF